MAGARLAFEVQVKSDLDKVAKQLEKIERQSRKTAKSSQKTASTLASVGTGLAAIAGSAAAGFVIDRIADSFVRAATSGLQFNIQMEQANTTFSVLLGSADAADKKVSNLFAYAAKTPFEFMGVKDAAIALEAVGINAEKALPWIGDLASVRPDAGGIEEVARAIARLQSGDFGESFERLRDFGISRKMLEGEGLKFDKSGSYKGSAEQAVKAVRGIVEREYGGMADKQSKTLGGMMSTMKDNISMGLGALFKPLFDVAKSDLFPELQKAFDTLGKDPAMKELAKEIAKVAKTYLPTLLREAVKLAPVFVRLWTQSLKTLQVLSPAILGLVRIAGSVAGAFLSISSAISSAFAAAANFAIDNINRIIGGLRNLGVKIDYIKRVSLGLPSGTVGATAKAATGGNQYVANAQGGTYYSPTFAMLGERGPERVVPLAGGADGGVTVNVYVSGGGPVVRSDAYNGALAGVRRARLEAKMMGA